MDLEVIYNLKVSLLLPDACGDFPRVYRDRKRKLKGRVSPELMFHQGPVGLPLLILLSFVKPLFEDNRRFPRKNR